jgi:hypothetical protein
MSRSRLLTPPPGDAILPAVREGGREVGRFGRGRERPFETAIFEGEGRGALDLKRQAVRER